ncbi:unnamed protein product, partial [Staurois parvus]
MAPCLCMAFNLSCLRFATLPWAPVPPPLAAARSRVCHGSLYGLPLLLTSSPDSAMCHFQVSLHCWWVPFFVLIGCCMAFHCCCLHRHPAPCASVVCSRCC